MPVPRRGMSVASALGILVLTLTTGTTGAAAAPLTVPAALSTGACSALNDPTWAVANPSNNAFLTTPSEREATNAAGRSFTTAYGEQFAVSTTPAAGLVPVHRLFKASDFTLMPEGPEFERAQSSFGYTDQGVSFWAAPAADPCAQPVHRYLLGSKHALALAGSATEKTLVAAGWRFEKVAFHAAELPAAPPEAPPAPAPPPEAPAPPPPAPAPPADPDTTFSIAVYPDTQQEVGSGGEFIGRSNWLVANREALDLRYVLHTGDVVNWGVQDPTQFSIASTAMTPLEKAGIPYQLSIGNHDTAAVCEGGSACPGVSVREAVRDTGVFNTFFPTSRFPGQTFYEAGKVDNGYRTFEAGGAKWLSLNLELWPRAEVVTWAASVVAAHPDHNVIVETHAYLQADGSINQSAQYGASSGQYLYDHLIKQYANIRFVFSGHVGQSAYRTDTGVHGNRITSMLGAFHSNSTNPVRLVTIDTATGTASTKVYGPEGDVAFPYDASFTGLDFVK